MMKFFRKHMKELLAIFMSLLLVIWLGGDAITQLFGQGQNINPKRGVAYGQTVKLNDMQPAFNELNILSALGVNWHVLWAYPVAGVAPNEYYRWQFVTQVRDPLKKPLEEEEWYMLNVEARHRRVFVPQETVERFKQQMGVDAQLVANLQKRYQVSKSDIDQAIQSFVRVIRTVGQASEGVKISEADIQNYVKQSREKAKVNVVLVDAAKLIDDKVQPTEKEMEDLFEKNKDRDPVVGSMNEFGYRKPQMVQIEYIQISQAELAKLQQVRDEEAYDYWSEHKGEFLKPSTRPATSAPSTQPEARQPYATFTEAKAQVIEKLQNDRAQAEALRLARELIGRLNRPWAGAAITQPGCKTPPAGEKSDQVYPTIISAMSQRYPGGLKYARTGLVDETGVTMNAEIGRANAFAETKKPVPFKLAAFEVCGLDSDSEANPDLVRLRRNVYETCAEPVVDMAGNAYVFRNMSASPRQAPPSWEAVRDLLVVDVRKERAYAEADRLAKALVDQSAKLGLRKAFDADSDLKAKLGEAAYKSPEPFTRKIAWQMEMFPGRIPGVGGDEKVVDACFELAAGEAQADHVKALSLGGRGWIVAEGVEIVNVNQTEYDEQRDLGMLILNAERQVEFLHNWFDPAQIRERIGWKDIEPEQKADGEEAPASTQPAEQETES